MVINFNPKYIPGDIVYNHKKEIIRITSSYLKGTQTKLGELIIFPLKKWKSNVSLQAL